MQQEKPKIVIDTNIVISATISKDGKPAKILELLFKTKLINYTSLEIIQEITEVIERPLLKKYINEDYKKFILNNFRKYSIIIKPVFNEKIITTDPPDNKFINCALTAKADIITGDRHLLEIKTYKEIKIISAKVFLEQLNKEE